MNTIDYLKELYGYGVPIFLNKIRIGGKSKTSIRKELSRAVKSGKINRKGNGVYYFTDENKYANTVLFETVLENKYINGNSFLPGFEYFTIGYYSGQTFLNQIGISQQVPAVLEITTNNTSCKRLIVSKNRKAIIRKGRTEINRSNYKALQFFDIFTFLNDEEIEENKELIQKYISENLTKKQYIDNIKYYPIRVNKIIVEKGFIYAFK